MKKLLSIALIILCSCGGKGEPEILCTIEIRCDDALTCENLPQAKRDILPADGVILAKTETLFGKNETVVDVLERVLAENKIHVDFNQSAGVDSKYVEAIANLYPEDCGDYAGWNYYVNGEMPTVGASGYKLSEGDEILFKYVSDFTKG